MFNALRAKLESAFNKLRSKGKLSEEDIDLALREIRKSLLEADVDFRVVKELLEKIRIRALDLKILESITAAQHVATVVYEELISMMGEKETPLTIASKPPTVILMVGLQGSGKTTTTVKLARRLQNGHNPLVVACDLRRPAATEQLRVLAAQSKTAFYGPAVKGDTDVLGVIRGAISHAESHMNDVILLDTAGRLHLDNDLMEELTSIVGILPPHETLLVVDGMTGQEAVNVGKAFHDKLTLTGLIVTKMDGDARGGSALAIRAATGVPVKFLGVGEATDALEVFDSRRMAGRVMGMGDIQGLLEKVQTIGEGDTEKLAQALKSKEFTLETLLTQFEQIEKMGPLGKVLEMIPGLGNAVSKMSDAGIGDSEVKRNKAIIQSMTLAERRNPKVIKGARRRRIALGSGTSVQMVNRLLAQYEKMKPLYKKLLSGKNFDLKSIFGKAGRF